MSVKIKVSYDEDWELAAVRQLSPVLKDLKASRNKQGRYKKAYVFVDDNELMHFIQNGKQITGELRANSGNLKRLDLF